MLQWPDLKFPPINHLTVWPTNAMCQIHQEYQEKIMTYQEKAYSTAIYGDATEYPFCSLAEEAGEVMGKLNKYMRKNNMFLNDVVYAAQFPNTEDEVTLRNAVIKEMGDIMWQLAACCTELGITLEELQELNLDNVLGRQARGTINGEGDNR